MAGLHPGKAPDVADLPMRRDLPQPIDAGGLAGGVRVETLCDGAGEERLALLGSPLQQRPLLRDQRVDTGGLLVQEPRDPPLQVEGRPLPRQLGDVRWIYSLMRASGRLYNCR